MMTDVETEESMPPEMNEFESSVADALAEAEAFLDSEESDDLEKTIQTMASTQLCVHPVHYHSFAKVTFALGASLRKCAGCRQGFKTSIFSSSSASEGEDGPADASIVKCAACGAVAHRSCAFSSDVDWTEHCPVNGPTIKDITDAFVVTDDEQDTGKYRTNQEEEKGEVLGDFFEVDLQDEKSDDVKRKNSMMSGSSVEESMESQDLSEEEEEHDKAVRSGENISSDAYEHETAPGPLATDSQIDDSTPLGQSPSVAKRVISKMLFPKRKEEGVDNPYSAEPHDNDGNPAGEVTVFGNTNGDRSPINMAGNKRTWLGNAAQKIMSTGKPGASDDVEEETPPEDDVNEGKSTMRRWFNIKSSSNSDHNANAEEETLESYADPDTGDAFGRPPPPSEAPPPPPSEDFPPYPSEAPPPPPSDPPPPPPSDFLPPPPMEAPPPPPMDPPPPPPAASTGAWVPPPSPSIADRAPWLYPTQQDGLEEDYGMVVGFTPPFASEEVSESKDEPEKNADEVLKTTQDGKSTEKALDAPKSGRRGWFNRKQNKGGDAPDSSADDTSTARETPTPSMPSSKLGFGLFKRSQGAADEDKAATASNSSEEIVFDNQAEEGQVPSSTYVSNSDGKNAVVNAVSASADAGHPLKLEVEDKDKANENLDADDGHSSEENPTNQEENAKGEKVDYEPSGDKDPSTANANTKSRFRLFSRKKKDSNVDSENTDHDGEAETPVADSADTTGHSIASDKKTGVLSETAGKPEGKNKTSLLNRVFTPAKAKTNTADEDLSSREAHDEGDHMKPGEPEVTSPRRLGALFSSKKAAEGAAESEDPAPKTKAVEDPEKKTKKFSLFGFRRKDDTTSQQLQTWASDEPPTHWATATTGTFQSSHLEGDGADNEDAAGEQESTALHYANHPFASVSRALQDNIMALKSEAPKGEESEASGGETDKETSYFSSLLNPKASLSWIVSPAAPKPEEHALGEIKPEPVQESTLSKVASGTYSVASGTYLAVRNAKQKMGIASVAGAALGGMAGFMASGPAGALMGIRYGQAVTSLGVILEGSVTIGVVVMGVAGGTYTAEKIQEQIEEQRVLTIGEHGISRKVMLVRPTIRIDPVWHDICAEAQRTSPSSKSSSFSLFSSTDTLKHERYEKTSDIVDEEEIPTAEKVLLLVSRVLTDKASFPGHVYRCLMQAFRDRCEQRKALQAQLAKRHKDSPIEASEAPEDPLEVENTKGLSLSPRARREDAHGLIKYITGTLLEVRPGLASTPEITETTASVVEALVFGEVYDLVYEEIHNENSERDRSLIEKIDDFYAKWESKGIPLPIDGIVSEDAMNALRRLPGTHAAADKLRFCVLFLEKISEHFAASTAKGAMGADSLLKMVCQHIVAAGMPCMNAEVAFLEEFARDEQLLRGKEGYALVTLQASLHFLNMSNDFERDIFGQENDEENIPIIEDIKGEIEVPEEAPSSEAETASIKPTRSDNSIDDSESSWPCKTGSGTRIAFV